MILLTGHQPEYLPYIGFFNKIMHADKFVVVDHVQFNKKNWQNRNKIRTANGWAWLSIPVYTKGKFEQPINEVKINNNEHWKFKHWKSIYISYKKAPYFNQYADFFEELYNREWDKLIDLNMEIIMFILKELDVNIDICYSSQLGALGDKTDLLVDMCKATGSDAYLSGEGSKEYIINEKFRVAGLKSLFRNMKHPVYTQQFKPFEPYMGIIDLLFNHGKEESKNIIYNCGNVVE